MAGFHKSPQGRYDPSIRFLVANRHPQALPQTISAHRPQDIPFGGERGIGQIGHRPAAGKADEHEIANARKDLQPKRLQRVADPGQPLQIVEDRGLDMPSVLDRGDSGGERGAVDVEGAANPVHHIDDFARSIGPANSQRGKAIDL